MTGSHSGEKLARKDMILYVRKNFHYSNQ